MVKVKKYNLKGEDCGEVDVNADWLDEPLHEQLIKDYVVAIRKNKRQWSASTRGRSEVNHANTKPHKQKGTGRARQGTLAAPQYKGGGVVFGPKPKFDQHVRINRKERQKAIRGLLADKLRNEKILVIDTFEMERPKTKLISSFLSSRGIEKRPLFLCEAELSVDDKQKKSTKNSAAIKNYTYLRKSLRNIPEAIFCLAPNINGYNVMLADSIVITELGLNQLMEQMKNG